jgi:hypothetical protein
MKYEREERSTETIGVVRCALSAFWEKKKLFPFILLQTLQC